MSSEGSCLIWGTDAKISDLDRRDGTHVVSSPRAGGEYFISGSAVAMLGSRDERTKVCLTSWLVQQRRIGVSCPEIVRATLDDVTTMHPPSVHDRADALLRYLDSKSDLLGTVVGFYELDNTKAPETAHELLAWTASRKVSEVVTLAEYCSEKGWVKHSATERAGSSQNTVHELMLGPPGYARLAELDGINPGSTQAFVAMWFDDSMMKIYKEGIEPAIRDAGYEPQRIDKKEHNNKIDDEIVAEIRRSRFLIADFTSDFDLTTGIEKPEKKGARGGVYYEAGFAHGLNIPVIFTCRADVIDKAHFDTRQYNHITWTSDQLDELRKALANRISATIGDGPLKKSD